MPAANHDWRSVPRIHRCDRGKRRSEGRFLVRCVHGCERGVRERGKSEGVRVCVSCVVRAVHDCENDKRKEAAGNQRVLYCSSDARVTIDRRTKPQHTHTYIPRARAVM